MHLMRISTKLCTTKLLAQTSWLLKNNIELWHYQIQNSWGKWNIRHLQNKTENLLHLHSEPWYFEVSDLLIISPLRGSPSQPNHMPSSPYMSQWGFVGAYLTFMKQTCTFRVPTRSPRKNILGEQQEYRGHPSLFQLRQHASLHEGSILWNIVTLMSRWCWACIVISVPIWRNWATKGKNYMLSSKGPILFLQLRAMVPLSLHIYLPHFPASLLWGFFPSTISPISFVFSPHSFPPSPQHTRSPPCSILLSHALLLHCYRNTSSWGFPLETAQRECVLGTSTPASETLSSNMQWRHAQISPAAELPLFLSRMH